MAIRRAQDAAGVEPYVGIARDQRVGAEARVFACILHHQHAFAEDGQVAKGLVARRFRQRRSERRLEPLTFRRYQRNHRNRCVCDQRGEPGDAIEGGIRRGIQQTRTADHPQSRRFVARYGIGRRALGPQLLRHGLQRIRRHRRALLEQRDDRALPHPAVAPRRFPGFERAAFDPFLCGAARDSKQTRGVARGERGIVVESGGGLYDQGGNVRKG